MNIYIVDLESIPTRYTCEWKDHLPDLLRSHGATVETISGPDNLPSKTTPGMFLNFGATNIYKAAQVSKIAQLFVENRIRPGDQFIFTDAWHPGIINLKYMSELLGIPVVAHGLWHSGSYDPADGLGRLVGNKPWVRHAEKSFFNCIDHNHFATEFHIDLFIRELLNGALADKHQYLDSGKIVLTGWPMEYMTRTLEPYQGLPKRNLILFPHRIAPEKQPERFRELAAMLPQYEWVICQEQELTKEQYHTLLGESKMVLSLNLQETLGISVCAEGPILNAVPLAPNRLSYKEIFQDFPEFLFPGEWCLDSTITSAHLPLIRDRIVETMNNYERMVPKCSEYVCGAYQQFFHANNLLATIFKYQ